MKNFKNKIYARINESDVVVKLFSSVFEQPLETDILIEEGNEEYHAHVHLKYALIDNEGRYNYSIKDNELHELTDEEKAVLFPVEEPVKELTLEEKYEELAELIGGTV